jgi:flagellin-like hook-associated protein FlgL
MSDIVLSSGVRANLLQLQNTTNLITQTQNRLATGKRVNSALDNPVNFFSAQSLTVRANDMNSLLDTMSTAINTIQAANNGLTAMTKLIRSAQSLAVQAQQTTDTTVRKGLSTQYTALLTQIDHLASDAGLNGINLLNGDNLTVKLNETATSTVTIAGVSDTANGALAINAALNNWATTGDINTASSQLTAALVTVRSQAQALSSNLQTVQVRQDFTKAMVNTLNTGADGLTLADTNEEGANLLALQTRQQLSSTALSLAAQSDQNVLRLFQ